MKMHDLRPIAGARHKPKRVGRGPGSGHGKTSCRGHKGQKSRSGAKLRPGFEGGQTPLYRRVPKRGFTHIKKERYRILNLRDLREFEGSVTPEELLKKGLLKDKREKIKILGNGNLEKALIVAAHSFSKEARNKIEKAGGKVVVI